MASTHRIESDWTPHRLLIEVSLINETKPQ